MTLLYHVQNKHLEGQMSRDGLSMRTIREILRLRLGVGLSADNVTNSCRISKATVSEYEKRFHNSGLSWPVPDAMDDAAS